MPEILSEEEILATLVPEEPFDVHEEQLRKDALRQAAERGEKSIGKLPLLPSVPPEVMRGLGTGGPHYFLIPYEILKTDHRGKPEKDEYGEDVWILKTARKKAAPFMISVMAEATALYSELDPVTKIVTMTWAAIGGEGEFSEDLALETYRNMVPPERKGLVTIEQVRALLTESTMQVGTLEVDAMIDLVHLCLRRYQPEIERSFVETNCDYALLCRFIGKILWMNAPMQQRFLGPSGEK